MSLFKTEMLCLPPPRTRRLYGPQGERGLRFGGRARLRERATTAHDPVVALEAMNDAVPEVAPQPWQHAA